MKRYVFLAALFAASIASAKITARMDAQTGKYDITSDKPNWAFSGQIDFPCAAVAPVSDSDRMGQFDETAVKFTVNGVPLTASIRTYGDKPLALFSLTYGAASDRPLVAFPDFTTLPTTLHSFNYTERVFAPPAFDGSPDRGPWMLFDAKANAMVISPASHFLIQRLTNDGHYELASECNSELTHIPAGFTQQTLVAVGPGINRTWDVWGHALTDLRGKTRSPSNADLPLADLGFWTDNRAYYYYRYEPALGYEGTLLKAGDYFKQHQIPVRYMQLDSWWYYKTLNAPNGKPGKTKNPHLPEGEWNRYGGLLEYKAHPAVLPDGLAGFQQKLDLPLITHNRWIDVASPYRQKYKVSGVVAIDPQWWRDIMSYLKSSGVTTYEQDWLSEIYFHSPQLASTVDAGDLFLDSMANAAAEQGMSLQYCMELPCYFLQGSRYSNLTTVRVSDDGFERSHWHDFLFVSRLASSIGSWPWADVCSSSDTDSLLIQALSGGMVGFGDQMGAENSVNLAKCARTDGVLVKPDVPIVPADSAYLAAANKQDVPLISSTYTDHAGLRTAYVFAFQDSGAGKPVSFTPAELGLSGDVYVYDYFADTAASVEKEAFTGKLDSQGVGYYIVASAGKSGIAFFGDSGKFVSTGKQRIDTIKDSADGLTAHIFLAPGEDSITLHGCSAAAPTVSVDGGTAGKVDYDPATFHFMVTITPAAGASGFTATFK